MTGRVICWITVFFCLKNWFEVALKSILHQLNQCLIKQKQICYSNIYYFLYYSNICECGFSVAAWSLLQPKGYTWFRHQLFLWRLEEINNISTILSFKQMFSPSFLQAATNQYFVHFHLVNCWAVIVMLTKDCFRSAFKHLLTSPLFYCLFPLF